ncbi:MAG: DNA repair protein RecO [bacterium]|nr:DNA repair protein RecO [bacterium]MDZ4232021.1 DNA repair protein RecO [Candidatus Pacearchaeota archaeon]
MRRHVTQAYILTKYLRGEADSLCVVFTKDFGKLVLRAGGEHKITSKLRGGLEPLSLSTLEFVEVRTMRITDAVSSHRFPSIKRNLSRQRTARAIVELTDAMMREGEPDEKVWLLLEECFFRLSASISNSPLLYYYFLWKILLILGYALKVSSCVFCGLPIGGPAALDAENGGFRCSACCKNPDTLVPAEVFSAVRTFLNGTPGLLSQTSFHHKGLGEISEAYLSYVKEVVQ